MYIPPMTNAMTDTTRFVIVTDAIATLEAAQARLNALSRERYKAKLIGESAVMILKDRIRQAQLDIKGAERTLEDIAKL